MKEKLLVWVKKHGLYIQKPVWPILVVYSIPLILICVTVYVIWLWWLR